jgi:hypothetical protein
MRAMKRVPIRGINETASVSIHNLDGSMLEASIRNYRPMKGDTGTDFLRTVLSSAGITPWFEEHPDLGDQLVDLSERGRPAPYGFTMDIQRRSKGQGEAGLSESLSNIPADDILSISIYEEELQPWLLDTAEEGGE